MMKIIATFGVSSATAGYIATVLMGMNSLSKWRLILALGATGIGAIIVAGLLAVGLDYVSRKIAQGEGALTQW